MKIGLNIENHKKFLHRKSQVLFIYSFLLILIIIAAIMDKDFLSVENFVNLITTSIPLILVSFAQTLVILTSGIDLSLGAIISLSNVICATLMTDNFGGTVFALVIALIVGSVVGLINGIIITKGKIQPIIITLSTSAIVGGTALAILQNPGGKVNAAFAGTITGSIASVPVPLIIGIVLTVLIWILLSKTRFGNSVYAIGGNENAAFSTGVMVDKIKVLVYFLAGLLSAMAGIFLAAQMYSGDPIVGSNFTMKSITAVVVGGTSLAGGKGSIIGSIAGVFILVIINNLLNLIGVPSFYQYILQGFILILALAIGSLKTRRY